ncbi:hypothetical protein [Actinoplanes xinjiangensis]|uniref:hypothetical protein n=1 Tax=Actinoplanes xinjiangensis TaxID=512350 RepID=UPI0034168611
MAHTPTVRRRLARGFTAVTLTVTALVGLFAAPAMASTSNLYSSKSTCLSNQYAYERGGAVRITKTCYATSSMVRVGDGIWLLKDGYSFDYVLR